MEHRRILLDGATGTNLYQMGMPKGVCVEEWVLEHPGAIRELQSAFAAAGSEILYAPTFSANRARLARYGHAGEVRDYCRRLVALTRGVADAARGARGIRVAGDLSPAGLLLEPYGDSTFDELVALYDEQARALDEAGVDLFVIETMLSVAETRAAVLACRRYGKPIFVSMTLGGHGGLYMGGTPACALVTFQSLGVSAFGLNCAFGPAQIVRAVQELAPYAAVPLLAKPNAGEPNPLLPDQYDIGPIMMKEAMREILNAGASVIGGCCGTTPEHIRQLRSLLDEYQDLPLPAPAIHAKEGVPPSGELLLSNENELFTLDCSDIELSSPIRCELDMADALLDAADEGCDVLCIEVDVPEEAEQFAQNAHMAKLPVCFRANSQETLERALYLYQGRCMADRRSPIPEETLAAIAAKYGAVLY